MKKILFITHQLPYPPVSGGKIITYKLIEFLSKIVNLDLVCMVGDEEKIYISDFEKKLNLSNFIYFPNPKKIRSLKNLILSYIYNKPLSVWRNFSPSLRDKLKEIIIRNSYDAIFVDHFLMFQYIPKNYKNYIILHEHNAEYLIWKRLSTCRDYPLLYRLAAKIESIRVAKYEKKICNKSDIVLCIGSNDIENLVKLGIKKEKFILVRSLGDEELLNSPDISFDKTEEALLYIGTLSWEPNVDGLVWFIRNCWENLIRNFPNLKLYIIGKEPDRRLIQLSQKYKNIFLLGFVEDVEIYYSKCRVFINPIRFGSGVKIKTINALYRGLPCVTTEVGAEGLDLIDGEHIFIAKNEKDFCEKVKLLLCNRSVWEKISQNGRNLAKTKYTSEAALSPLKEIIYAL
jgi:glycosyltransferase involved in cell wall biosynthesis